ncbi:MAG: dihydropteroate synthase [Actinomycetota bacterium]
MTFNPRVLELAGEADAARELKEIGADTAGIGIMRAKAVFRAVKAHGVDTRAANILKQEMLARGGDVAVARDVITLKDAETDVIILGTDKQFALLIEKLKAQPFGLKILREEIQAALISYDGRPDNIVWDGHNLPVSARTCLMGVLNVTPDSFSDGGQFGDPEVAIAQGFRMAEDGADIIDVGGESTRPGADSVPEKEEIGRVVPVIKALSAKLDIPISIDTYKSGVARAALDAGASMINDISGMTFDSAMAPLAAKAKVPVALMHIKGTPKDMQADPVYDSMMSEISGYLRDKAQDAIGAGIAPNKIIIDPGIGFGKTVEHNLEIIRRVREFKSLGHPVLIGPSRKSFIGKILGLEPDQRLEGTAAAVAACVAGGASIVRVHDVKEMARVARVADAVFKV